MASKARFLDNVGVSAFGTNSGGGSSISSSYALSASYADFATSASYAISASYEITKEVSSSYADTASFAQSGDGIFSGSFSGSFQGDGSNLTGVGAFPFSGSAVITGSLTITGSQSNGFTPVEKLDLGRYYFKTKNSFDTGLLGSFGGELIISSSDFDYKTPMVVLDRTQGPFGDDIGTDLWARNNLFAGGSTYVNGIINTLFSVTGSGQTGQGGVINLGNPYGISPTTNVINLYGHLTASAGVNISASATSTASFGTYLGDGSQLSNISTTPFPFTGDAQITGSLIVSGSGNITSSGYMLITSSNTGGSGAAAMTPGLVINQQGSSQNYSGPAIRLVNATNGEESNIYHQPGGSGAAKGNALNIITDGGINIEAGDDIGSGGAFFRLQKGQALFTIDDDSSAPRTDVKIHNGNGGTAYSRLSLGASNEYWYIEADDNNTPFNIGFDNGSTDTDVITFTKHDGSLTGSFAIIGGPLRVTGSLISSGSVVDFTGATAISGSTFSGSFVGDGSQLTGVSAFPFTGDAQITGSLVVSSSNSTASLTLEGSGSTVFDVIGSQGTLFSVDDDLSGTIFTANDISGLPILEASASGDVYIGKSPQSLYTTAVISSTTAAVTQSIFGLSTSSYDGAFFDYTVQSGSNARAGSIMSIWSGSTINYTETTTTDIGNTTDFNLIVHISQSQAQIASHATNAGYKIKTIIRSI